MRTRLVACAVVLAALLAAAPAQALSRKQAEAVALRVLKPEKEKRVVLFGLPAPLKATQSVAVASPSRGDAQRRARASWRTVELSARDGARHSPGP